MMQAFRRTGELKDLSSYPSWLQGVVKRLERRKNAVVQHELFALMRDAKLPTPVMRRFLIGAWPTIEQFPQFMAMNLKKLSVGEDLGQQMARRYLIHNIRVEQKHADHWIDWANSAGVTLQDLKVGHGTEVSVTLSHWCWYVCDRASLPVAIAATNYAVEGVTGEWSSLVCSKPTYAESIPDAIRAPAMRWLRLHAHYDDTHPWEALEIIASLLGNAPSAADIEAVERAIRSTYTYFELGLENAMAEAFHGTFDETASNASTMDAFGELSAA